MTRPLTEVKVVSLSRLDDPSVVYRVLGMTRERLQLRLNAPSRRTVSRDLLTQSRRASRRRYEVEVLLFEPHVTTRGGEDFLRPDTGAVYEQGAGSTALTTREQIELVEHIASLHEQGVHLRYSGITLEVPRCTIVEFSTDTVFTSGTATIVVEEQPEPSLDVASLSVSLEALDEALRKFRESQGVAVDDDEGLAAIQDGVLTKDEYLDYVRTFIADSLKQTVTAVLVPTEDSTVIASYGLKCLPLQVVKGDNTIGQMFPTDSAKLPPRVSVVVLQPHLRSLDVGGRPQDNILGQFAQTVTGGLDTKMTVKKFSFLVFHAGVFVKFRLETKGVSLSWDVTAEVYQDPVAPRTDVRGETNTETDVACAEEPARPVFSDEGIKPIYTTATSRVVYGREVDLTTSSSFAFVGLDGLNPYEGRKVEVRFGPDKKNVEHPRAGELALFALVLADYRT